MSLREKLSGSISPIFTPFTESGDVDHESLSRMVKWQHKNGSSGISFGGSTGEPSSLSLDERVAALQTIKEAIGDSGMSFVPGTGSASIDDTLELTSKAQELGVDAALIITPYYSRPTQEALYQWYGTIAREFPDLPLIAYNVPSRTAVELEPETFARLYRDFDNVVGIKETTKDFEHFSRTMFHCDKDLLMWSGIELLCLPLLSIGGIGFISALSNIAPAAVSEIYSAATEGNLERAQELHYGVHPLVDLLFVETNPAPAKWLMAERGLISSPTVRSPLINLTEAGQEKVRILADSASQYLTDINI